jgi:hypothetical protein
MKYAQLSELEEKVEIKMKYDDVRRSSRAQCPETACIE